MRRALGRASLLIAALAALAVGSAGSAAQTAARGSVYHIDHLTVEDGLAQNTMSAVAQDRSGFIWVGGYRGLQRYDGYSFVRYDALDPAAPRELGGQIVEIQLDARGDPWVETPEALFHYDAETSRFLRVALPAAPVPDLWAPDSAGRIWAFAGGVLHEIDGASPPQPRHFDSSRRIVALAASGSHALWLCVVDSNLTSIVKLDPRLSETTRYAIQTTRLPQRLVEDADGLVWIAADTGLALLDPVKRRYRELPEFDEQYVSALGRSGPHGVLALSDAGLFEVANDGRITTEWNTRSVFGVGYLPTAFAFDREGGVWLASITTGLFRLDVRSPVFHVISSRSLPPVALGNDFVTGIAEGKDGTLWITTLRGGAQRVSAAGAVVGSLRQNSAHGLPTDEVWGVSLDRSGIPWLATAAGLCAWEASGARCYGPSTGAYDIAPDSDGWLWIACSDGVRSFNPSTRRFGAYVHTSSQALTVFVDTTASELWVGGEVLAHASVARGQLIDSLRPTHNDSAGAPMAMSYQFHRGADGTMCIASDDGLGRWDARKPAPPTHVDLRDVAEASVFSIAEDASHALWLGTSQGLVHYVPSTGASHRYARQEGVTNGEFNRHAVLAARDGSLIFGGVDGYVRFRPEQVSVGSAVPPVVFTHARRVTDHGIVDAPLNGASRLTLDRHDRAITIDFAALTYGVGAARRYRFQLEGSGGNQWIETSDHRVTYTAPRPGGYRLRVQAAMGEATWAEPGAALAIEVLPPFWRTGWFETLVLAAAAALLFMLHRLSLGRALATERLRLRISHDLHDEIGAGLSSIALLSDSASADPRLTGPARAQLQRIGESARDMVADLRDIIWSIDPGADHVDDVVARMRDLVPTLLPGVRVVFEEPEDDQLADRITMTARRDLLLVYKELLNNIAKHAQATDVRIQLTITGGTVSLTVNDNGRGFAAHTLRRGTGLKSMRERARRLGATLTIDSEPGRGTTAQLTLRRTRMRQSQPTVAS